MVCQCSRLLPISTLIRSQGFSGGLSSSSLPDKVSALCKFQPLWQTSRVVTKAMILLRKFPACTLILLVLTMSYFEIKKIYHPLETFFWKKKAKIERRISSLRFRHVFPSRCFTALQLFPLNVQGWAQIMQRLRPVLNLSRRWDHSQDVKESAGVSLCGVWASIPIQPKLRSANERERQRPVSSSCRCVCFTAFLVSWSVSKI